MTDHVLALDLSLTSTGAATIDTTGRVDTWVKTTEALDGGDHHTAARIREITLWCRDLLRTSTRLVVVEGPSFGSTLGQPHERSGLWWAVRRMLAAADTPSGPLPVGKVVPKTLKHRITGDGKASKIQVRNAVAALYPGQGLSRITFDEADAVGLATLGVIKLATVYGRDVWPGPWLDARSLAIDSGCTWEHLPERADVRA